MNKTVIVTPSDDIFYRFCATNQLEPADIQRLFPGTSNNPTMDFDQIVYLVDGTQEFDERFPKPALEELIAMETFGLIRLVFLLDNEPMAYLRWYVQRWCDDESIPHYHGIRSEAKTIGHAQTTVKFNMITSPIDLVYGPCGYQEMMDYLHDVNNNPLTDDDELSDVGTLP